MRFFDCKFWRVRHGLRRGRGSLAALAPFVWRFALAGSLMIAGRFVVALPSMIQAVSFAGRGRGFVGGVCHLGTVRRWLRTPAGCTPYGVKRVAKKGGSLWGESNALNPALVRFFHLRKIL